MARRSPEDWYRLLEAHGWRDYAGLARRLGCPLGSVKAGAKRGREWAAGQVATDDDRLPERAFTEAVVTRTQVEAGGEMTQDATPAAEYVDPASLVPWDRNPRRNTAAVADVARSIIRFGFGAPILARAADRRVIAGHTRLQAALSLPGRWRASTPGERKAWSAEAQALATDRGPRVPVRFLNLDDAEATALSLADNKLGELAEWDPDKLLELIRGGADLAGAGFTDHEIADLLADVTDGDYDALTGADVMPSPDRVTVTMHFTLTVTQAEAVERALDATAIPIRGEALAALADAAVDCG